MSAVWGSKGGDMPNELSEIEVDEVSVVDRPATGKRFVLFKRGGFLRRSTATTANICSQDGDAARIEELEKAAAHNDEQLAAIRDLAEQIDRRLAAVEAGVAPRQSSETQGNPARLWAGVL